MEWTDESIARLRVLWQEGLSTAEIGRRMQITKNAVVGKAHRLDLSARPSPIRKAEPPADAAQPKRPVADKPRVAVDAAQTPPVQEHLPAGTPVIADPVAVPPDPVVAAEPDAPAPAMPALPDNVTLLRPEMPNPAVAVPEEPTPKSVAAAEPREPARTLIRPAEPREPRRRGLTCCWPLGEPGTKGFHFCGADPTPGKPYCAEHASLAYVKLRDRRDSVA